MRENIIGTLVWRKALDALKAAAHAISPVHGLVVCHQPYKVVARPLRIVGNQPGIREADDALGRGDFRYPPRHAAVLIVDVVRILAILNSPVEKRWRREKEKQSAQANAGFPRVLFEPRRYGMQSNGRKQEKQRQIWKMITLAVHKSRFDHTC